MVVLHLSSASFRIRSGARSPTGSPLISTMQWGPHWFGSPSKAEAGHWLTSLTGVTGGRRAVRSGVSGVRWQVSGFQSPPLRSSKAEAPFATCAVVKFFVNAAAGTWELSKNALAQITRAAPVNSIARKNRHFIRSLPKRQAFQV